MTTDDATKKVALVKSMMSGARSRKMSGAKPKLKSRRVKATGAKRKGSEEWTEADDRMLEAWEKVYRNRKN